MNYFKDKNIYITGGSSGMGLDMARRLFASGAHLLLVARDRARLDAAVKDVERFRTSPDQRIGCVSLDVADAAAVGPAMERAGREFGHPDMLINSAGVISCDYFENITDAKFDSVMKINLYGTRNMIAALLPLLEARRGHVAIVASMAGLAGMFGYTAYGTSKFALIGFSECIRPELKRKGIRLTVACPPEVDTPMMIEEGKTIPPGVRALKNAAGRMTSARVAKKILAAIARRRYLAVLGFQSNLLWRIQRFSPGFFRMTSDLILWMAVRKTERRERGQ